MAHHRGIEILSAGEFEAAVRQRKRPAAVARGDR